MEFNSQISLFLDTEPIVGMVNWLERIKKNLTEGQVRKMNFIMAAKKFYGCESTREIKRRKEMPSGLLGSKFHVLENAGHVER